VDANIWPLRKIEDEGVCSMSRNIILVCLIFEQADDLFFIGQGAFKY
jgi:hypothetical protein